MGHRFERLDQIKQASPESVVGERGAFGGKRYLVRGCLRIFAKPFEDGGNCGEVFLNSGSSQAGAEPQSSR